MAYLLVACLIVACLVLSTGCESAGDICWSRDDNDDITADYIIPPSSTHCTARGCAHSTACSHRGTSPRPNRTVCFVNTGLFPIQSPITLILLKVHGIWIQSHCQTSATSSVVSIVPGNLHCVVLRVQSTAGHRTCPPR